MAKIDKSKLIRGTKVKFKFKGAFLEGPINRIEKYRTTLSMEVKVAGCSIWITEKDIVEVYDNETY